ncbi:MULTISPECIES: hypothetical protein [Cyanophyceae]|uniref:hypothetical protein n=1 Tax=Cyanophyceae TaxID=3028117 RepID=UPI0016835046|nr:MULTISPECIES: hypothetical protein [Cyanophyceae]MBD1918857.1 hypothetical protein [Phormidium sp. FACHB-77]MBD2033300.1 hypothetical protein [Phormidium sp. FACHB-322]MBD2053767.1 hypothetical protein [Leptolyngbya sp. FACHB-60]
MDNQLVFTLGSSLSGLAAELLVRLIGASGDLEPAAPPIAVTESATLPGLYRATMAGAEGTYGAVLLRGGVFVAGIPAFDWSGAEFEKPLTAAQTQEAASAAIAAYPVAKPEDVAVTVLPTPVTVEVDGGFLPGDRADLQAAKVAGQAVAIGDHAIDYANSTATQKDAAGNVVAVFDLRDEDGNLATSPATAVKRVRRP